jgi:hypothetical protein
LLVAGAGTLAFLLCLGLMLFYFYPRSFSCPQCSDMKFDSEVWKNPDDDVTRVRMVDDLLENHSPIGLSKEMAEELLGPLSNQAGGYSSCDYSIRLGRERSMFALDPIYLCLRFENGIVSDARVVEG